MARRAVQYIDAAGLRLDGRRPREIRVPSVEFGTVPGADGSCLYTAGSTIVSASVFGPRHVAMRSEARPDEAILTCQVAIGAVSGDRRRQVRRNNRQTDEYAAAVTQALESSVFISNYPNAAILVAIEVIQADGNETAVCITAASLALASAGVAMKDLVIGSSAALLDGKVVTDVTSQEARSGCPVLSVSVMAREPTGIVSMSLDARVADASVDDLYAAAVTGCADLGEILTAALRADVEKRVEQRGADGFVHVQRK